MKKSIIIAIGIIILSFAVGLYFYPSMPERMASHWNFQGRVDGYMSKFWGLFLMPIISFAMFLLFVLIPKIDPLKANVQKFRKYFDGFIILMMVFLFYIYLLTILWSLGSRFNMGQFMLPALGALFYYCGVLIEKTKRNWFIGIRTPWTLSSDEVWDKTHKIGGQLFKISGLFAVIGACLPKYALLFFFIPVLFSVIYTILYSYFTYRKAMKMKK